LIAWLKSEPKVDTAITLDKQYYMMSNKEMICCGSITQMKAND